MAAGREPGRPANATAIASNALVAAGLRRPYFQVDPGICSANVTTSQAGTGQRNRRTSSRRLTERPATVASCSVRRYRECTRDVNWEHPGQSAPGVTACAQIRNPRPAASTRSTVTSFRCGNNTLMALSITAPDTTVDGPHSRQGHHQKWARTSFQASPTRSGAQREVAVCSRWSQLCRSAIMAEYRPGRGSGVRVPSAPPIARELGKREIGCGGARTTSARCVVTWVKTNVPVLRLWPRCGRAVRGPAISPIGCLRSYRRAHARRSDGLAAVDDHGMPNSEGRLLGAEP